MARIRYRINIDIVVDEGTQAKAAERLLDAVAATTERAGEAHLFDFERARLLNLGGASGHPPVDSAALV